MATVLSGSVPESEASPLVSVLPEVPAVPESSIVTHTLSHVAEVAEVSESELLRVSDESTQPCGPPDGDKGDDSETPTRKLVLVDSILKVECSSPTENLVIDDVNNSEEKEGVGIENGENMEVIVANMVEKLSAQGMGEGGIMMEVCKLLQTMARNQNAMSTQLEDLKEEASRQTLILERMQTFSTPPHSRPVRLLEHDPVLFTPRKLPEPRLRMDMTPVSAQNQFGRYESGCNSAFSSKRSLTFPKSLMQILDTKNEEQPTPLAKRSTSLEEATTGKHIPEPATMRIKQEPFDDSYMEHKGGLSLLVLADAAVKQKEEDGCSNPSSEGWMCSDDSGRSTGDSYPDGSPMTYQNKNGENMMLSSVKMELTATSSSRAKQRRMLPKSSGSETSSATSPLAKKTRKRRKVKQPLPCQYCGKNFNNQSSLRQHESFHRPTRPYKCEHAKCDKAYKTRSELNRHIVVHSGEKKHFCKLCGKRFLRKQYLKTHLIRHHETGITMVTPAIAKTVADFNGTMRPAVVTVASSTYVTEPEPLTWRCNLCYKIFVNKDDLKKHERSYHEKRRSDKIKL